MASNAFLGASGKRWRYSDDSELGRGGFGVVHPGHGPDGESIAVKLLDLVHPLAQPLDLLMREVDVAKRIQAAGRDHLLPTIDHAVEGTTLFLVMDRAERSLAKALKDGLAEDERFQALRDMAAGLVELQGIPILHRDLKPGNVLFHDGRWKLADFGISRDFDESTATLTWAGAGTVLYMAPELFDPPYAASPKSDLYALGCVAFEMWTGDVPFRDPDSHELVRMHKMDPVPPLPASMNVTLRRVIVRLLDKDPNNRPQDARAVVEALGRVVIGPISPEAARLQELAAVHVDERSRQAAKEQEALVRLQAHKAQVQQAMADLREVIESGCDYINEGLPEVVFTETRYGADLSGSEAALRFRVWMDDDLVPTGVSSSVDPNQHVLYGEVDGENQRMEDEPPLANIVCEVHEGRLVWMLYRYRRTITGSFEEYRFGPDNRRHGFSKHKFLGQNIYPYLFGEGGIYLFRAEVIVQLTPIEVRNLFAAALALPDDG